MRLNQNTIFSLAMLLLLATVSNLAISQGKPAEDKANKDLNRLNKQWYLSNTVSAYDANTEQTHTADNSAVLGKLKESKAGYDKHDIRPFASLVNAKIAVLFIQDGWGERSGEYHSDYRGLQRRRDRSAQSDNWVITVVSTVPGAEVTLSWKTAGLTSSNEGGLIRYKEKALSGKVLKKLHLIDLETLDEVEVVSDEGQLNSYTFTMNTDKTSRQFRWVYGKVKAEYFNNARGVKQYIAKKKMERQRQARKIPSDKFGLPPV